MQENSLSQKFQEFEKAWALLTGRQSENDNSISEAAIYLPTCGFAIGVAYFIIAQFVQFFGGQNLGSAFAAAIIIQAVWSYADRGLSLSALTWSGEILTRWQERYYEESSLSRSYNVLVLNCVLIAKVGAICFIIQKNLTALLIIAPLVMAASIQANAAISGLLTNESDRKTLIATTAILAILTGLFSCSLVPVVLAVLGSAACHHYLSQASLKHLKVINKEVTLSVSEFTQTAALLILLIFAR